jgi:hypothetical protein
MSAAVSKRDVRADKVHFLWGATAHLAEILAVPAIRKNQALEGYQQEIIHGAEAPHAQPKPWLLLRHTASGRE